MATRASSPPTKLAYVTGAMVVFISKLNTSADDRPAFSTTKPLRHDNSIRVTATDRKNASTGTGTSNPSPDKPESIGYADNNTRNGISPLRFADDGSQTFNSNVTWSPSPLSEIIRDVILVLQRYKERVPFQPSQYVYWNCVKQKRRYWNWISTGALKLIKSID